jgi:transcriptional regulator with XRE-family HTH domain
MICHRVADNSARNLLWGVDGCNGNVVFFVQKQQKKEGAMQGKHNSFAQLFKALRKQKRITLRAFCDKAEADPGNISRMERGAMPPPQDRDILIRYANALEIYQGSDDWYLFFDLAAADRGIIPKDIMEDEELVQQLPAFFRTLRGQKPTEDDLRRVVEKIKKS